MTKNVVFSVYSPVIEKNSINSIFPVKIIIFTCVGNIASTDDCNVLQKKTCFVYKSICELFFTADKMFHHI